MPVLCDDEDCDETGTEETGADEEPEDDFFALPGGPDLWAVACAVTVCAGCCVDTLDDEVCCTVLFTGEEEAPADDVPDSDDFGELNMYVPAVFEFLASALGSTPLFDPEEQLIRNRKVRISRVDKTQRFLFNFPVI